MTEQLTSNKRVAIVEDEDSIRNALVAMVGQLPGITLAGAAASVADGRRLLADKPDVMLVDLGLKDGSGLTLIDLAQREAPSCKMLVVSVFGDVRNVVRAIELGAAGYLLKTADLQQTGAAIALVLSGGAPISPAIAGHILQRIRKAPPSRKRPPELTARELEILEALAKGLSFKETGQICGLSHHTVGDHVKAIYRKLAVNSRAEAIFEAIQSGLIDVNGPERADD